jgi:hypothetical protein
VANRSLRWCAISWSNNRTCGSEVISLVRLARYTSTEPHSAEHLGKPQAIFLAIEAPLHSSP